MYVRKRDCRKKVHTVVALSNSEGQTAGGTRERETTETGACDYLVLSKLKYCSQPATAVAVPATNRYLVIRSYDSAISSTSEDMLRLSSHQPFLASIITTSYQKLPVGSGGYPWFTKH